MAVRAIGYVTQVNYDSSVDSPGEFSVMATYISDIGLNVNITVNAISMNSLTNILFVTAIRNAVKADLITNHGYTFGLLDTVYIMNSNIL